MQYNTAGTFETKLKVETATTMTSARPQSRFAPHRPIRNADDTENLTAAAVSSSQINLGWSASTDNVGVTGYRVYRCQGSSCTPSTQVGTATTTSYSDTGLTANTQYRYRVRATDAASNLSSYSSTRSATTLSGTTTNQPPTANAGPDQTVTPRRRPDQH